MSLDTDFVSDSDDFGFKLDSPEHMLVNLCVTLSLLNVHTVTTTIGDIKKYSSKAD